MPQRSNKMSRFWQELKRRRVIHVITVYASASFVIIELINNLEDTLNFPPNLLTIVVIVLAVGFPLAIILSWLYDVTSEGVEKTKPIEEVKKGEKTAIPNAWKIATYVSFVVIVGLLTFNIIGGTKSLKAGDIQSLVILPFDNFTGDDQLDYVAEGMHDLLIGDIGRISNLRIIGGVSARAVKNRGMSLPEIAKELNVHAVVEPTLTCYGEMACIQLKVITLYPEEKLLWVEDYMEDKSQMLNLNNRITRRMADEMMIEITPEEDRLLSKSRTVDREVYDAYLRSYQYWDDFSEEPLNKAKDYLNGAIEKDPEWAPLYIGLANVWMSLAQQSFELPSKAYPIVYECLDKALEMDPDHPQTHYILAMIAYRNQWDWAKSEKEFLKALAGNPNNALSRGWYAHLLCILNRPDEGLTQAQLALDLDPINPLIQLLFLATQSHAGDYAAAQVSSEKFLADDPDNFIANQLLNLTAFNCGDYNKVIKSEKNQLQVHYEGRFDEDAYKEIERIFDEKGFPAAYEKILSQWEELANNKFMLPCDMAFPYIKGNQLDKAMDLIEKGYEIRDPSMPYIGVMFNSLYDNPRFIAILEKMNLPMPED